MPDQVQLLDTFARLVEEPRSLKEGMNAMLNVARELTGRSSGVLGRFDSRGKLDPWIGLSRGAEVPPELLHRAREQREPFVHRSVSGEGTLEWTVAPLGDTSGGVLVLEGPVSGAPAGESLIPMLRVLAQVIWGRMVAIEELTHLRDRMAQIRFSSTPHNAVVMASSRLVRPRNELQHAVRDRNAVFLHGEAGTETEDLARVVHAQSSPGEPFVSLDIERVPSHRISEELFGATNATDPNKGCLKAAREGTLLIHHPESLPLDAQEQLVRHLESGSPVRLIACSEQSPTDLVKAGNLDPRLAEHIQRREVFVPPLRSKPSDVAPLVDLILREMGPGPSGEPRTIQDRAVTILEAYDWPGNVRELRSVLESASSRAGGREIQPKDLPREIRAGAESASQSMPTLKEVEKRYIIEVVGAVKSKREASKVLGIAPSTLYEKLSRYDIRT